MPAHRRDGKEESGDFISLQVTARHCKHARSAHSESRPAYRTETSREEVDNDKKQRGMVAVVVVVVVMVWHQS